MQGLADAGDGGSSRKESHKSGPQNGLGAGQPKRARTTTPTPAPKLPRLESRPAPPSPAQPALVLEEEEAELVESGEEGGGGVKQEMWMVGAGEGEDGEGWDGSGEGYEQDLQAEDEQYIQAGGDSLSGQQVGVRPFSTTGQNKQTSLDALF